MIVVHMRGENIFTPRKLSQYKFILNYNIINNMYKDCFRGVTTF